MPPPEPEEPTRTVSITMSPIHLIAPIFEAMVEVRPTDHFGIALIGGYGRVSVTDNNETVSFRAYEIGGQASFYPMDAFDNLALGLEVLYINVDTDELHDAKISGVGEGIAVGPFVGYKLITSGGFTFVVQGGAEYVALRAKASDTAGNTAKDDDTRFIPLINLNLGWSF